MSVHFVESVNDDVVYEKIDMFDDVPIHIFKIEVPGDAIYRFVPKHWHRSIEIIIPIQNGTRIWHNGHIDDVMENDFFLINSREIHSLSSCYLDQDYHGYCIQIKYDGLKRFGIDVDRISFIQKNDEITLKAIYPILLEMIDVYEHPNAYSTLKYWSLLYALLYEMMRYLKKERMIIVHSDKRRKILTDILSYIDNHFQEDLDIKDIAHSFHYSYGHLASLFKEELRMSVSDYLSSIRLQHAVNDLLMSDLSIVKISLENGFPNTKSFTRVFKKRYDMTPHEYRIINKR